MDMMNTELGDLSDDDFGAWLQSEAESLRPSCEEEMASILSDAMRTEKVSEKVELYAKLANLAMDAADTTLGAQGRVRTAITLTLH